MSADIEKETVPPGNWISATWWLNLKAGRTRSRSDCCH